MVFDGEKMSSAVRGFATEMEEARQIAKVPELFSRTRITREKMDEICVLRRWNSHTPSVWDTWGGGYFLRWQGKGIIIDPGCSFIKLFRSETPYEIGDINMIIATHDHIDHCQDLGTVISLFREYNKWLDKQNHPPKNWDLLMSLGVEDQINSLLVHPENSPFLRWSRILPPEDVEHVQPPPSIAKDKSKKDMELWSEHLSTHLLFYQEKIIQKYGFALSVFPTLHRELLGGRTGLGLQFKFPSDSVTITISGDTGFDDELNLEKYYKKANVLILHVGTMEGVEGSRLGEHLGLNGVTNILIGLNTATIKLVVLTEWGYEFGRLPRPGELGGRSWFTRLVEERLHEKGCDSFRAATSKIDTGDRIPIIPADIGLRIRLPDLYVWSSDENTGKGGFVPGNRIWSEEKGEEIIYHSV